jgi:hypothetical protein
MYQLPPSSLATFLTGGQHFKLAEIEIFQVKCSRAKNVAKNATALTKGLAVEEWAIARFDKFTPKLNELLEAERTVLHANEAKV